MIIYAVALFAGGIMGYFVGGAIGVTAVVTGWAATLIVLRRLKGHGEQRNREPVDGPQTSIYANIDDVIDRLDELALERDWDLGKRFEIALMACENPSTTFDELERRYDRGTRSAFDRLQRGTSVGPKNDQNSSARFTISPPPKFIGVIGESEKRRNTIV